MCEPTMPARKSSIAPCRPTQLMKIEYRVCTGFGPHPSIRRGVWAVPLGTTITEFVHMLAQPNLPANPYLFGATINGRPARLADKLEPGDVLILFARRLLQQGSARLAKNNNSLTSFSKKSTPMAIRIEFKNNNAPAKSYAAFDGITLEE